MKLTVMQENLAKGLVRVNRAIASRPQLPILANVLLEAKGGELSLLGTDLELGIKTKVGAKVEKEGRVAVPARMLTEFVTSIPVGKVELELEGDQLKVRRGRYVASFQVMEASEYPEFPQVESEEGRVAVFDQKELNEALQQVAYAAAKDSMRPVLTGVLFELGERKWRLVATDGFRLAMREGKGGEKEVKVVVPRRAVSEVMRLEEGEVRLRWLKETNQVVFESGEVVVVSQVLEGGYPDYRRIIPKEFRLKVIVERGSLLEGVMVGQVFAKDNSNIMKWQVGDGGIKLIAESPEQGKNEVMVEAEVDGGELEIAFNGRFLLDFLQNSRAEKVVIGLGDSLSPGSFREEGVEEFLYIVMPINL